MQTEIRLPTSVLVLALGLAGCQQAPQPVQTGLSAQASGIQVESKWTLRDDQAKAARDQLKLSTSDAEQRSMYFYDTRSLDLYRQGLILRARKVKNGDDESTVKFRPMTSDEAGNWAGRSGFKCEVDVAGSKSTPSCSWTAVQPTGQIDDVRQGALSVKKLFSSDQEAFAASKVSVDWAGLKVLGPTPAVVWKKSVSSLKYPYTVEQWTLPSGVVLTEVSTKTAEADAASASAALKAYLTGKGLVVSTDQETKTQRVLSEWTQ